jgi:hypothetical protein
MSWKKVARKSKETPKMTRVEQLKDRIIEMIDKGCTGFSWFTGDKWHDLSIEEKADAILQMWDAPKVAAPPVRSGKPPVDVREFVKGLSNADSGSNNTNA